MDELGDWEGFSFEDISDRDSFEFEDVEEFEKEREKLKGEIMAELFAYRHDEWEASLRKIGFFLGKFVYLMDAYEDVEKDLKNTELMW